MRGTTALTIGLAFSLAFVFCTTLSAQATPNGVSSRERQALVDLYQATGGDHWKNREGWLGPPGTECAWKGVDCRSGDGKPTVAVLDLVDNNLVGTLPPSLAHLTHLDSLSLSLSHLGGLIPEQIGALLNLTGIDLLQNDFSGMLPEPLIQRWLAGKLWISAEPSLLTDISQIDFEAAESALLCSTHRIILRSDGSATLYTERCRNAHPGDRATYCEVMDGHVGGPDFPRLGWLVGKNGFFALRHEYDRSITEGSFLSTRVTRAGRTHEVVDYAGAGSADLWAIEEAIEGIASSADWQKTSQEPKCPRWASDSSPGKR